MPDHVAREVDAAVGPLEHTPKARALQRPTLAHQQERC